MSDRYRVNHVHGDQFAVYDAMRGRIVAQHTGRGEAERDRDRFAAGDTREARKYKTVALVPTATGWRSLCYGVELQADTLAGIKRLVSQHFPGALRYGRRARW